MSAMVPSKGHRHTLSDAVPASIASSQNPQNPHHLTLQSHGQDSQPEMSDSYQSTPTTPPRTPRRNDHPHQNRTTDHGSKQRSRNKNRPKNVVTSPAVTRKGRHTPPLTGAQSAGISSSTKSISTPSTAAYAGATFHASPAPSALPIPSFYSKSVPDSPGIQGFKLKEVSLSESPNTPLPSSIPPSYQKAQVQREESPLDFFFKADREQKARAKSASSSQNAIPPTGPFNLPGQSPKISPTPPITSRQTHASHTSKASPSAIFAMEVDDEGSSESPIGPAFSTPYADRIKAARPRQQPTAEARSTLDRSEALKAYLFADQNLPSSTLPGTSFSPLNDTPKAQTSPATPWNAVAPLLHQSKSAGPPQRSYQSNLLPSYDHKSLNHGPRTSGRSSGLRQEVTPTRTPTKTPDRNIGYSTPSTPSRTYESSKSAGSHDLVGNLTSHIPPNCGSPDRSADIQGMEESLRKILKLDSVGNSGRGASVSVSNYAGGRAPPVHNGVLRS